MSPLFPRTLLAAVVAVVPCVAQRLLVVDGLNRPGAGFTDLPAAEAAAQDGDVLQLRSDGGPYAAIQTSKALTIVSDAGQAMIRSHAMQPFRVSGVLGSRSFAMKGCRIYFDTAYGPGPVLQISNCGRVHLDMVDVTGGHPTLDASFSYVTIKEGRFGGGSVTAVGCLLDMSSCGFIGPNADSQSSTSAAEAISLNTCDASLVGCSIIGGFGDGPLPPAPALRLFACLLDLGSGGGGATVRAGSPGTGTGAASAVVAQASTVRQDPLVQVNATNGAPLFAGVVPTVTPFPSLSGTGIQSLQLRYAGVPGEVNLTVFGISGGPFSIPGVAGNLWVDPGLLFVEAGVMYSFPFDVPIGLTLVAQVLSVSAAGLELSNAVAIVGR